MFRSLTFHCSEWTSHLLLLLIGPVSFRHLHEPRLALLAVGRSGASRAGKDFGKRPILLHVPVVSCPLFLHLALILLRHPSGIIKCGRSMCHSGVLIQCSRWLIRDPSPGVPTRDLSYSTLARDENSLLTSSVLSAFIVIASCILEYGAGSSASLPAFL